MVSHDKKLYNNLVQMAMLASLLRFQPELGGVHEPPLEADLILGQSWAHTSARTVHAHLEHAAHHKNIDNVIERYQEELFEELHSLGRYQRPFRPSHIQAYQLLDGEADLPLPPEPEPEPGPPVSNSTLLQSANVSEDLSSLSGLYDSRPEPELDLDLELDLELGLERDLSRRLELELEAGLPLPPPPAEFDVWEMMDADLAEEASAAERVRSSLGADTGDDFIQSDVDMSDEDAEAIEVLLRQDMVLGASPPPSAPPSLEDGSAGSCCSPEPLDDDDDALVPLKPAQEYVSGDWPALEAEQQEEEEQREQRWRTVDDWEDEEEDEDGATEEEHRAALRHLWQRIDSTADPETGELFSRSEEGEEEGDGSASLSADRRPASEISDVPEKVRHVSGDDSGQGSSAESEEPGDAELALLDEMIETVRRRPELVQGRLPFIRTMSMEQRWQDLASLLSLPAQEAAAAGGMTHAHQQMLAASAAHHPAYPYGAAAYGPAGHPAHHPDMARSVLLQNASLAPPPPPPPAAPTAVSAADLVTNASAGYSASGGMGSVSHLGSAVVSSMNLTTDGLHPSGPAATSAAGGDMMYYQNSAAALASSVAGAAAADPPPPPPPPHDGGFLSQILGVDELQLMEMPMSDGHAEWAVGASAADDQFSAPTSDYAKASQAHRLHEYSGYRATAAAASPTVPGPPPDSRAASLPSAQLKKHQFFGKRYFQGADGPYGAAGGSALPPGSPSPAAPLKYPSAYGAEGGLASGHGYPPSTPGSAEAAAAALESPELKYSCSMDFMRGHPGDRIGLVSHNHSYHLPPQTEGPSGVQRQLSRDKHGDRPKEHLTRDEKRARSMSIPLSNEDIIHLPMDEFNERLSKHDLTEAQLSLIRDIRRRGKNKLAAQNCRKRKLDQILTLAEEVQRAKDQKQQTLADHQFLLQERSRIKEKYSQLYRHVFQSLRDPDGNPYSPLEYSLQQSADGSILLVPRNTTSGATVEPDASTGARRKQRDPQKPE
ncbi:endoplasmic reticulum membrane sensor NFE2L1-like [Amphibalanus amphitrite]|uniref:endoplasmic reticulum membrane sensor NFE2L1-like n=1 Tax=Amphibalanus amphitrite TaxID=1232801 RepID=UPI001C8FE921|nr:endoplasmic reticulum membrane sensor NFE2L1-like [Amphibalanus amphitrite]